MARCAGVQNVSRPMERCHETSQWAPIETDVTANAEHHRYHGICPVFSAAGEIGRANVAIGDLRYVCLEYGNLKKNGVNPAD